ncbi:10719_t:CDS:1, partial [Gigaspora rosea]
MVAFGLMVVSLHVQHHSSYLDAKKFVENLVDENIKAVILVGRG